MSCKVRYNRITLSQVNCLFSDPTTRIRLHCTSVFVG